MQWELVIALVLAVPIMAIPAAFVWYLTLGGIYQAVREAQVRRALHEGIKAAAQ